MNAVVDQLELLKSIGVADVRRGDATLQQIRLLGVTSDLIEVLLKQMRDHAKLLREPDRVLTALGRYISQCGNPLSRVALFERDPRSLPTLLQCLSVSERLAEMLIADPEAFELLRVTGGQAVRRELLVDELQADLKAAHDEAEALRILRRFHDRELLRIAYGDFVMGQKVSLVSEQLSHLADAVLSGALAFVSQQLGSQRGPSQTAGAPIRFAIIGLGKLGGQELSYCGALELLFVADLPGTSGHRHQANLERAERLGRGLLRLIGGESIDPHQRPIYQLRFPFRPILSGEWATGSSQNGEGGIVTDPLMASRCFDLQGRTWERMMLIKARTVAGDVPFGNQFLDRMQPWIYRRYLSLADIAGIRRLKRKLERSEGCAEASLADGIGEIQFCTQFLQLLNGGDLETLRCQNTQRGLAALAAAKCLTPHEHSLLEESYLWMRGAEHRREFGMRLAAEEGLEFSQRREVVQQILQHLLEDAFPDDEQTAPETDLILDPTPSLEEAHRMMSARGFTSPDLAYQNLSQLARERSSFLSTRRCRHFLAAIAPRLLEAISHTPDPDTTLSTLGRVADSLGGKGTLWELLSSIPATVEMFVRLCACSPYLSDILIGNPGMIDELMDALILNRLPTEEELSVRAEELCRGATDVLPILRQFKHSVHLQTGLREILGKSTIEETHWVLSATAESCLRLVIDQELRRAGTKLGVPRGADGTPLELVVIALGKLGGQEPNYHSDLDLLFLYDAEQEGTVFADRPSSASEPGRGANPVVGRSSPIPAHFFGQLAQNVVKLVNQTSPQGRLYEIDVRLRPNGLMATSLKSFAEHFQGRAKLSDRQALLKSRPIYGSPSARAKTMRVIREIIQNTSWNPADSQSLLEARRQAESNATSRNLKRSRGGTLDVEFLAQCLQMQHVHAHPAILVPGTLAALHQLEKVKILDASTSHELCQGYLFLRRVESGLRLLNTPLRHDLPTEPRQFALLAYLLGEPSAASIAVSTERIRTRNRELFLRLVNG